jgi:hypothetical protein
MWNKTNEVDVDQNLILHSTFIIDLILEVCGSNIGRVTGYPDQEVLIFWPT